MGVVICAYTYIRIDQKLLITPSSPERKLLAPPPHKDPLRTLSSFRRVVQYASI